MIKYLRSLDKVCLNIFTSFKRLQKIFVLLEPEESYYLFTKISEIKSSNVSKQLCNIFTSLELDDYELLSKMVSSLKDVYETILKKLNILFNFSSSATKSLHFKINVQEEINSLIDICNNITMFTNDDKQKLYNEITKILNFSLGTVVAFALYEIISELEKCNETITGAKIFTPTEDRIRFIMWFT